MLNTFSLGFQHFEVNLATSQLGSTCTTVKQPRVVPPRDMSDTQWYLAVSPGLRTSSCIVHLAHLLWVFHSFTYLMKPTWDRSSLPKRWPIGVFHIVFHDLIFQRFGQLSRQIETVDTEIALLHLARWEWPASGGQLEATQRMHVYAAYVCMLNMYVHHQ